MPDLSNVVWLPIRSRIRVTIDLLRDIAPDARKVPAAAAALGYKQPDPGLRDAADRATAEMLGDMVLPSAPVARRRAIEKVLQPLVDLAMSAIDAAMLAGLLSDRAVHRLLDVLDRTGTHDPEIQAEVDALIRQGDETFLRAHAETERALGAWRAVEFALKGMPWTPRDPRPGHDWLWLT